jgi:hypothetical protein
MQREFDPVELINAFNANNIRYVLIGRQAVVQYGANLFSFDYDFWVHPEDRTSTYKIIRDFGLSGRYSPSDRRPVDMFTDDEGNKVDIFFVKSMSSRKMKIHKEFDRVLEKSVVKKDVESIFFVRIPCIEDLIELKQLGNRSAKDAEDIEYLKVIKKRSSAASGRGLSKK